MLQGVEFVLNTGIEDLVNVTCCDWLVGGHSWGGLGSGWGMTKPFWNWETTCTFMVDDKYPVTELFKRNYICSTLRFEPFHPQVPALMGWNVKKPSTEGNKTSTEATCAPVPVLNLLPMPLLESLEFLVWWIQMILFGRCCLLPFAMMLQECIEKLTE